MKRQIIKIDEEKCNGCGLCVPDCPEGAIKIIDGKAKLTGESLCDGLGACIGRCPVGAITIEERDVEEYNEKEVIENVISQGIKSVKEHLAHLKSHDQNNDLKIAIEILKEKKVDLNFDEYLPEEKEAENEPSSHKGCPGMMMMDFSKEEKQEQKDLSVGSGSALRQWPVQLKLLNTEAPYFKGADLVVAADCVPFSFANFHERFLKGKILIIFCPKLDLSTEEYVEKLAQIIKINDIRSLTAIHMEVPCCSGTTLIAEAAIKKAEKAVLLRDYTISLKGEVV